MRYLKLSIHIIFLLVIFMLSACASPAKRNFEAAEKLETDGKFEEAMYSYAESFKNDPTMNDARMRFFKMREKAANEHFKQGTSLTEKGDYIAALTEFQSAQGIDSTQGRFNQQIEISKRYRDAQMAFQEGRDFEKGSKFKDAHRQYIRAAELFPNNKEYQAALERIIKLRKSKLEGYELRLKSEKPITLKFKDAKMKDVFNILTQLSGINFVFDDGIKDAAISIYIENASFRQALDLLTNMNKLGTKNLNETSMLVYMNSPEKSKQYDDMVLRTFHLNYLDAKKAINLIRTMIQVRKAYVNEDSNSIVVRDTEDVVNVVEKILDANDLPEAEVVLDVEVIEVSDKNAENIGLLLSNYNVQLGAFSPDNKLMATSLTGATTTVTAGATNITTGGGDVSNLVQAFTMKGFGGYVTVPNATFNLGKTLAKGEVLSNPKIRVKNKEKAKFNVGTRVPITTTTMNGVQSQVNVQYVDVGVKVNAEPTIQLNNEISIKLNLEVSSILTKEKVGSDGLTTVVTIGTRNIETVLSLKDNETSIIGGLIQRSDGNDKTKMYLLSDIPLIGPLFTNTNSSKDKTELMLAITPRLIRGVPVPLPGLASFGSGKEDHPSLIRAMSSFDQEPEFEGDAVKKPVVNKSVQSPVGTNKSVVTPPVITNRQGQPVSANVVVKSVEVTPPAKDKLNKSLPLTELPKAVPINPADSLIPVSEPPKRTLLQIAAPPSTSVGQQFKVDINITDVKDLADAPFVLSYDPVFVDFISITEGDFLKKNKGTTFSSKTDSATGTLSVSISRTKGDSGASGSGTLATISFRAKNQGAANFAFKNSSFISGYGAALNVLQFSTAVDIR